MASSPPARPSARAVAAVTPVAEELAAPSASRVRFWRVEPRPAVVTLAAMAVVYAGWLGGVTLLRHRAWLSTTYDLAIFDQGTWLVSHLVDPFVTVRGIHLFGDHASLNLIVLAPLYRLWPFSGPSFLLSVQAVAVALGVFPLYRLARVGGARSAPALAVSGAYVMSPLVQNVNYFDFHPEVLSVPLLLWAVAAAWERRWAVFGSAAALAVLGKEDVAVILLFVAVWLFFFRRERRVALLTAVGALAVLVLELRVLIPHFSPGGSPYGGRLAEFGTGPVGVAVGLVTRFDKTLGAVVGGDGLAYLGTILLCVGLLPLLEPALLLPAVPTIGVNLLSNFEAQRSIETHYIAGALPFLFASTAVAVGRIDKKLVGRLSAAGHRGVALGLALAALVPGVATNALFSNAHPSPSRLFRSDHAVLLERASAVIPPDAAVAASYYVAPHVAGRREVYLFPQPFDNPTSQPFRYVGADQARRLASVQYVFLDQNDAYYARRGLTGLFPNNAGETWGSLRRFYQGWDVVFDDDGIVVARRPGR